MTFEQFVEDHDFWGQALCCTMIIVGWAALGVIALGFLTLLVLTLVFGNPWLSVIGFAALATSGFFIMCINTALDGMDL